MTTFGSIDLPWVLATSFDDMIVIPPDLVESLKYMRHYKTEEIFENCIEHAMMHNNYIDGRGSKIYPLVGSNSIFYRLWVKMGKLDMHIHILDIYVLVFVLSGGKIITALGIDEFADLLADCENPGTNVKSARSV